MDNSHRNIVVTQKQTVKENVKRYKKDKQTGRQKTATEKCNGFSEKKKMHI